MTTVYKAAYISLHVRQSNRAAIGLYRDTLGFTVDKIEPKYCESFCLRCFSLFSIRQTGDIRGLVRLRWGRCVGYAFRFEALIYLFLVLGLWQVCEPCGRITSR